MADVISASVPDLSKSNGAERYTMGALEKAKLMRAGKGHLRRLVIASAAECWIQLHDAAAVPDDGAIAICSIRVGANDTVTLSEVSVSLGVVIVASSTQLAKTLVAEACLSGSVWIANR